MDDHPAAKRLVQELEEANPDRKRALDDEVDVLESQTKRIKIDEDHELSQHPDDEEEIRANAQRRQTDAWRMFWEHEKPWILPFFASLDFEKVYAYMKEIPGINQLVREDRDGWKRRLVLEYPEYWTLNRTETGEIQPTVVATLLHDTAIGKSRLSGRPATAKDAFYLLYQKARRLTRYLNRVVRGKLPRPMTSIQADHEIPYYVRTNISKRNGRFFVTYNRDVMEIFDLASQQAFTVALDTPSTEGMEVQVRMNVLLGTEYLAVRWDRPVFSIRLLYLPTRRWLTDAPVRVSIPVNGVVFSHLTHNDVLIFADKEIKTGIQNYHTLELRAERFIDWLQQHTNPSLEDYDDVVTTVKLEAGSIIKQAPGVANRGFALYSPWFPDPLPVNVPVRPNQVYLIQRLNYISSYERPCLFWYKEEKDRILTDTKRFIEIPAEHLERRYRAIETRMRDPLHSVRFVALVDGSNVMKSQSPLLPLMLRETGQQDVSVQFVYANYLCRVYAKQNRILVYDLWELYRNSLPEEEKPRPLISCSMCSQPATGVCSDCRTTAYCSEECRLAQQLEHFRICKRA